MVDLTQDRGQLPGPEALFAAAPVPMLVMAPDGPRFTIAEVNDAYLAVTMRSREDLVGKGVFEAMPDNPADLGADGTANLRASLERVVGTRLTHRMAVQKYDIAHPAGGFEERWWEPVNSPVLGQNGEVVAVIHQVTDVSERVRAQQSECSSEAMIRLMADAVPAIVWISDGAGRTEFFNRQWTAYTGAAAEPRTARDIARGFVHPDDEAATIAAFEEAQTSGTIFEVEHRIRSASGDYRWFLVRAEPYRDPMTGKVRRWFGASVDVHDRKLSEAALRALNDTLEAQVLERTAERDRMWDASPELMLVLDRQGIVKRVNPAWAALLGYSSDELVGRRINDFAVVCDTGEEVPEESGFEGAIPARLRHKDGSLRWISWTSAPADDTTYATGRDLTEERERVSRLRLYGDIVQSDDAPVVAFDTHLRVTAFNLAHAAAFERVMGRSAAVGELLPELFPAEQAAVLRPLMERALAGESFITEEEFGTPDGQMTYFEVSYNPLRDESGRTVGAFHRARDVTARRRAEDELRRAQDALRQSQKMEAMGQLTGGVAHDFNNLLTPIVGSLDLLQRRGVGNERERRLIDGAVQSADRAKTLVQRLLAFARRQPLQATTIDLSELIGEMVGLILSTVGPRIDVRVELENELPLVRADANQLEMAILNLAVNARDAMPDGGALTIGAGRASIKDVNASGPVRGDYVRLWVEDTGIGMDEATCKRAVEPFFSTKGIGRGTGLGLSMVHGLAGQLGGELNIASRPGAGTCLTLWLPVSIEAASRDDDREKRALQRVTPGRVLLVDDEYLVRVSTADMLADLGYEVAEAKSAEEALRLLQDQPPAVLITDHVMPGMTGADLARTARELWPDLPILLVSGYAEAEGVPSDLPRLTKPFLMSELAAKLHAIAPPEPEASK